MGHLFVYIFLLSIWAIIRNLINERAFKTKEQKFNQKSRSKVPKFTVGESINTVRPQKAKYIEIKSVENDNSPQTKKLISSNTKNEILDYTKRRDKTSLCVEEIFTKEHLLSAVILKEVLDPPKAIYRK